MKRRGSLIAVVAAGVVACDSATGPPSTAARLEAVTAISVTGTVGAELAPVPAVRATSEEGEPVAGLAVAFRVGDRSGTIANPTVRTDADGAASVGRWTLGSFAGSQTLTTGAAGLPDVVFTATAVPGPAARLTPVSGNDQTAAVGESLPQPLRVRVADSFGNPVPDAPVTFELIAGAGSIDGGVTVSDSNGYAASGVWTLGPESGLQQVRAASGTAHETFSAIAIGPPTELQGRLAFVREVDRNADIYVVNADGSGMERLTTHPERDLAPAWSSGGERIAFTGVRDGRSGLYVGPAEGANFTRRAEGGSPAWSPDGLTVAFAFRGGLAALDLTDGTVAVLRSEPGFIGEPSWSPDGRRLAYVSDFVAYDFTYDIYTMNADGTGDRRLTQGFDLGPRGIRYYLHPAWSPDGSLIAYVYGAHVNQRDMRFTVAIMTPAGAVVKELAWAGDIPWDEVLDPGSLAWSPDGLGIAYTFFDCDRVRGIGCSKLRSVRYVSLDGSQQGTIVSNAHSPSWGR